MIWLGIAPAEPIKEIHCLDSKNIYSRDDAVTASVGVMYNIEQAKLPESEQAYNIEFVKPIGHPINGFKEHGILEPTYQKSLERFFEGLEGKYGFYKCSR